MHPFKVSVTFRIIHPSINPDEISTQLVLLPRTSGRVGDSRKTPNGDPLKGKNESTYWTYPISCQESNGLADILESFTDDLEIHRDFLLNLYATGGRLEYFVGWFSGTNSGEEFKHGLLRKLADLHINLSLDVYC
jgi:hypothetical protein